MISQLRTYFLEPREVRTSRWALFTHLYGEGKSAVISKPSNFLVLERPLKFSFLFEFQDQDIPFWKSISRWSSLLTTCKEHPLFPYVTLESIYINAKWFCKNHDFLQKGDHCLSINGWSHYSIPFSKNSYDNIGPMALFTSKSNWVHST